MISNKIFKLSTFSLNVLKLSASTLIASGVTVLTLPILTKIFSVSDLGKFQMIVSVIMLFGVVASLKYEMALVLPKDRAIASQLYHLSIFVLIIFSIFVGIFFLFFYNLLLDILNVKDLSQTLFFIPLGIFFYGFLEIIKYGLIRFKKYNDYAKVRLLQVISTQLSTIGIGLIYPHYFTLFGGYIFGYILTAGIFFKRSYQNFTHTKVKSLKSLVIQYKKFPLVNSSMVFLNTLSNELPVFFIAKYFSVEMVGFYMLAQRISVIPMNLLGTSVTKVYFQSATDTFNHNPEKLLTIYKNTIKKLAGIGVFPFLLMILLAPIFVELIFGTDWNFSAVIMQILALSMFMRFITSPISTTFTVLNKQEIALFLTVISVVVRFGSMYIFRNDIKTVIWALTLSTGVYYLVYNLIINKLIIDTSKVNI